jgi:AraC family transcriptional regulator
MINRLHINLSAANHLNCVIASRKVGTLRTPTVSDSTAVNPVLPREEAAAWRAIGVGWRQLYGSFRKLGVSFEWHDFKAEEPVNWATSFHEGSVEICLNLAGNGLVRSDRGETRFAAMTAGFYCRGKKPLEAVRNSRERHQFITVELAPEFLERHLAGQGAALHPLIRTAAEGKRIESGVGPGNPMNAVQQQLISSLRNPPVFAAAHALWYQGKAAELMAQFFFQPAEQEFFCTRQHRIGKERTERVMAILQRDLANPPTLEQMAREVGCSAYYLSRTFSQEIGSTIPQYLQRLRMERAAELLRSGKYNVTEAALEVGYSSFSHFSLAFRQTHGCCPGLFPVSRPKDVGK